MADYMAAEIWIGGKIPARLVPRLCQAICQEGVAMEWGDSTFSPITAEALRLAVQETDGVPLLWLCDNQARWGQFEELEAFLIKRKIPFRRRSEGKFDADPEIVEHRPGAGSVRYVTNSAGHPMVPLETLKEVEAAVDKALAGFGGSSAMGLMLKLRAIQRLLRKQMPPPLPPLEPFEIVESAADTKTRAAGKPISQRPS